MRRQSRVAGLQRAHNDVHTSGTYEAVTNLMDRIIVFTSAEVLLAESAGDAAFAIKLTKGSSPYRIFASTISGRVIAT
jgi:hypothetical protein